MEMKNDILIVGAGPTGLTAALALCQRGFKPRIIDRRSEPASTSNALAIQPCTLELWQRMGLIDDALAEGHTIRGMTISSQNKAVAQLSTTSLPTPYPYILALPQAKTEKMLIRHLESYGVTVERQVALEDLSEKEGAIEVICNGKTSSYAWVLGCDGINSTVRHLAKIPFHKYELPNHFIMADLKIDWERDPNCAQAFLSSDGPLAFLPFNNAGFGRLIVDVSSDERLQAETRPTLADFQAAVTNRCHIKAHLHSPEWISSFWIHCGIADTYRCGRIFLAGDAAHHHSPFGGQGLNLGVQDAVFIAALIADVIEGKKDASTLDSYDHVRRPLGEAIVRKTTLMTQIMTTRSSWLQYLRNVLLRTVLPLQFFQHKALMNLTQLIYRQNCCDPYGKALSEKNTL